MPVRRAFEPTDPVVYVPDPLLYGEMEVHAVRKDKRIVVRMDPDRNGPPCFELFDAKELRVSVPESAAA